MLSMACTGQLGVGIELLVCGLLYVCMYLWLLYICGHRKISRVEDGGLFESAKNAWTKMDTALRPLARSSLRLTGRARPV